MDYLAYALIMLMAQFSPGPDMLLLLRNAVNHPLRAGLCTVLGIVCGLTVHTTLALTGVAVIFRQSPAAARILGAAGGLYLLWLAYKLLRSVLQKPAAATGATASAEAEISDQAAFLQGLITNLLNPKAALFLLSSLAAAMGPNPDLGRKLIFAGIILGQALVFWSLFVWLLKLPGASFLYRRAERGLNALFGLGLAGLALHSLWQAVSGG